MSMKHCLFKPLQLLSIMKNLFSLKGRREIVVNTTAVKRCDENLIPSHNIVMGITEISKRCITKFSEVNKEQMYGNQNSINFCNVIFCHLSKPFFYSLIHTQLLLVAIMCSSYINVLYSYITFTILDFLHSIEIPFRFSSSFFFSSCACICASIFLLICILFLFNTDVNWLPGSASPHGYSRQLVLNFTINNFIEYCNFLFKARMNVSKNNKKYIKVDCMTKTIYILNF